MPLPPELVGKTRKTKLKPRQIRPFEPIKSAGRPRAIGETEAQEICQMLLDGGSLLDAADALFIDRSTIIRARRENEDFAARVRNAIAQGKLGLIKDLKSTKPGHRDGAKFQLERRHGREWGRRDRYEHSGLSETPAPAQTTVVINQTVDYDLYQKLFESDLTDGATRPNGDRIIEANGNRESVHPK